MKKQLKLLTAHVSTYVLGMMLLVILSSCESEFNGQSDDFTNAPPVVTSVSEVTEDDVQVTQGVLENTYVIRGENLSSVTKIYFNGEEAGFNPALSTDNIVFVKIPKTAPVLDENNNQLENKLVLENLFGKTEVDFSLLTIREFTEATVNGKKVVNLFGGDFSETTAVTFVSGSVANGNLVEKPANFTIISPGEVQAEVPSGVEQAFIFIETARGASAGSTSFGFNLSIYIDGLNADWFTTEWDGTHDLNSTEQFLGDTSIKSVRASWSGLTFLTNPNVKVKFSDFEAITFSIYATSTGPLEKLRMAFNGSLGSANEIEFEVGGTEEWIKITIPLSDFYPNGGAPENITRIDFQEASNTTPSQYIYYIDDFGLL